MYLMRPGNIFSFHYQICSELYHFEVLRGTYNYAAFEIAPNI